MSTISHMLSPNASPSDTPNRKSIIFISITLLLSVKNKLDWTVLLLLERLVDSYPDRKGPLPSYV